MRFYRRVKCLTAVSLLFLALDNCSAVIKMIPPSFTSYCTKPVLLVPKQNISHRCYRGFKENSGLNWTCDCGYSTLLLEMKVMFFFSLPPPTQRCSDIQPRGVRGHRSSASHSVSLPLGWWVDLAERGVAGGLHSRGPHLQKHVRDALPQVRVAVCLLCAYLCRLVNKISLGVCSC